jgi:hypothetical protein
MYGSIVISSGPRDFGVSQRGEKDFSPKFTLSEVERVRNDNFGTRTRFGRMA